MSLKSFFSWFETEPETMEIRNWRKVRKAFIAEYNCCAICGSTENLTVHHLLDKSRYPKYQFEWNNLITLCNGSNKIKGLKCHVMIAHLWNWQTNNYDLLEQLPMLQDIFLHKKEGDPEKLKKRLGFK